MKNTGKGQYFVYIVSCKDGSLYTGYTNALNRRLELHNSGKGAKYTRSKRPVKLVYVKEYKYHKSAAKREYEIKMLTRKEKQKIVKKYGIRNNIIPL